jgi:hypothetical protein
VTWLRAVAEELHLSNTSVHLAVYLLDIFMDNHRIVEERLSLVALVCISLAGVCIQLKLIKKSFRSYSICFSAAGEINVSYFHKSKTYVEVMFVCCGHVVGEVMFVCCGHVVGDKSKDI